LAVTSSLIPLLSNNIYTDNLGHIFEIDNKDDLTFLQLGFKTTSGKFVSNISKIKFTNLSYIDENAEPQNTSFAIFTESVFDNTLGQNPTYKKSSNEFQNEVFLVNLNELASSASAVNFKGKTFELFQTLANNTIAMPVSCSETYVPYFYISKDQNQRVDSFCFMRGFAEFFIAPEVCDQNNSIEGVSFGKLGYGIYPNPVNCESGECYLNLVNADATSIYTLAGVLIKTFDQSQSIAIDGLNPGIYFIKGSKGWTEKIVVK
jgi:hypothetical protein